MSWLLLETNLRLYAERLRHNMAVEELALFPAAQRYLDTADWRAIEKAVPHPGRDPLFAKSGWCALCAASSGNRRRGRLRLRRCIAIP